MGSVEHSAADVEIRRSARRRRTVSARREDGRTIVLVPEGLSVAEEARWVEVMIGKLERRGARQRRAHGHDGAEPSAGQSELARRAERLSRDFLEGRARATSVVWVGNQQRRWGSCTPATGEIRLSERVRGMPGYVVDYVLIHELAHLLHADHGPRFWALVGRFPRAERARGFLDGYAAAAGLVLDEHE
ncbi:MAG: M48 family metallopeptidase [Tetrasphaera sp.]